MLVDLQGAQSADHRDRGIARYVMELARAIEDVAPERVTAYLLNPDLALPGDMEFLVASGKVRFVDELDHPDGALLHLASPFELSIGLERLFPPGARWGRLRLVTTLFDLIPEAMPDHYLEDPGLRRRYRARRELVRHADHVIAISAHTAAEATRLLGVGSSRLSIVELAPAPGFRPNPSREGAVAAASSLVPGLERDFVLYTAGSDSRKNVEGLLEAWAALPVAVRDRWQLVLACHVPPLQQNHWEVRAAQLGFRPGRLGASGSGPAGLLVTGWVPETALVALTQAAGLVVFPSLAEGFGLPVAEALACATPVIASNRPPMSELLDGEALFDAASPRAMAGTLARALTDEEYRGRLVARPARPARRWTDVAAATIAVYDRLQAAPAPPRRRRPPTGRLRLALATPLPPQPGGVADYSTRLLAELCRLADVDALVDGPPHHRTAIEEAGAPAGVPVHRLASLARLEATNGPYDAVVYSLGNSEFHTGSLAALAHRPGIVLAHDVRLTNLYRFAAWQHPEAAPGGFHATLQRMYGGRLPPSLGAGGALDAAEADRWGVFMARDVIGHAQRFLVTSHFAAELARLDARPGDRHRIAVLPFSVGAVPVEDPAPADRRPGPPVVASFGVVNASKRSPLVVEAFAIATTATPGARLAFVGPAAPAEAALIRRRAEELGIGRRVELTGEVDQDGYRGWLQRAWVAVQLRSFTNGESSGATGDCLAAGIPVIASAVGPNRALPADAAITLPAATGAPVLAAALTSLLSEPGRRAALGAGALRYAADHSFRRAAEALYSIVSP